MEEEIICPYCGETQDWRGSLNPLDNPHIMRCYDCERLFNVRVYVDIEKIEKEE